MQHSLSPFENGRLLKGDTTKEGKRDGRKKRQWRLVGTAPHDGVTDDPTVGIATTVEVG